jgi:ATP-dependent Clp protease protease subunit
MEKKISNAQLVNGGLGDAFANEVREQRLLESRTIFMSEGVSSDTARRIVSDLLILDSMSNDPIYLYINSPGGEVNSGFAIYDTIRFLKSEVKVVNAGLCASIATIINCAVKKENRYTLPNTRFLIHQPLIMGHIQGQASDLEIHANEILKTRDKLNGILSTECGQPLERVEKDTLRDYWMNSEEAKDYGLITNIVTNASELK